MKKHIFIASLLVLVLSCKHESYNLTNIVLPSNLQYSQSSIQLKYGTSGASVKPTIVGSQPISYTIATTPNSLGAISIDGTGVIQIDPSLPVGTYAITITASNPAGGVAFNNIYQITITDNTLAPYDLKYTPDTVKINEGDTLVTAPPTVSGTTPLTFSMTSSPSDNRIGINSQGCIVASPGIPAGTYTINVIVSNKAGNASFAKALVLIVKPVLPANLNYTPGYLNVLSGNSARSVAPTVTGSQPISYSLSSSPVTNKISIDNAGIITASNTLGTGTYNLTVTATNSAGSATFANAYVITVSSTATAPSNLSYSVNSMTLTQGQTGASVVPNISGTTPVSFTTSTSPASNGNITVGSSTGVISALSGLAPGTYTVTVTASNMAGSAVFNNVYTITVNAAIAPSGLSYSPNSTTVAQGTTVTSAVPVISGTQPITYAITSTPATTNISVNAQGVISSNSSLTAGTYVVSVTASNAAGKTTFNNAYTITITAPAVSFANNIKPLIMSSCSNCHTGGGQINYTIYTNTKNNIDLILDRIQRTPGSAGFMPKNGPALTADQVNLFKQWKADNFPQ